MRQYFNPYQFSRGTRMDYRRIIPCLDVKDGRLVKGVNFVDLKDVGDPAENGAAYSETGADELVFLDITATIENRKTMVDAVLVASIAHFGTYTIQEMKEYLAGKGIPVRL